MCVIRHGREPGVMSYLCFLLVLGRDILKKSTGIEDEEGEKMAVRGEQCMRRFMI